MGKLQTFEIHLDNNQSVFYGAQWLIGRVLVTVSEPMKARAIRLQFSGRAYTHWTETIQVEEPTSSGWRTRNETIHHSAERVYFKDQVTLWGNPPDSSADPLFIPPGSMELPFQFQLPINCPTSFEGRHGWIRYVCQANIDRPWRFDPTTRRPFTMIRDLDLNLDASATLVQQKLESKTLGCLCCVAGDISAQVRIGKLGWVPGEQMSIVAEVTNGSSRRIKEVTATLEQVAKFHADLSTETWVKSLGEIKMSEIPPRGHQTWNEQFLTVPSVPPTMSDCEIIKIDYRLNFCVTPTGLSFDLNVHLPVLIGTIPLRMAFPQLLMQPAPILFTPSGPPMPLANQYPDLPPPSYAECTFGKVNMKEANDNEHITGELQFAPCYTFYNFPTNNAIAKPQ